MCHALLLDHSVHDTYWPVETSMDLLKNMIAGSANPISNATTHLQACRCTAPC
jgi:hypothetical protein